MSDRLVSMVTSVDRTPLCTWRITGFNPEWRRVTVHGVTKRQAWRRWLAAVR